MKKTTFRAALVMLAGAISLTSCGDDMTAGGEATGRIVPSVSLETSLLTAEVGARADNDASGSEKTVTADDLSVTLTSEDGSFSRHWDKLADFPTDYQFPIGNYVFEVGYGDSEAEGFDAEAAYADSKKITVAEGRATGIELCATQTHAMVSIVYTEAFKNYLARATVNLTAASGAIGSFVYSPTYTESRPLYIKPGQVTLRADIEKRNGVKATNLDLGGFVAEARRHYHVTVDLNEGNVGGATMQITFDDQIDDREEIEINLSDELLNMPAPEFTATGLDNPEISFVENAYPGDKVSVNVIARGGLKSVTLNVKSVYFNDRCEWPVGDFDLMTADAVTRSRLTSNGLDVKGLWSNPDAMAVIDFTEALSRMSVIDGTDNAAEFTLSVTDRVGKTTEAPLSFIVRVLPLHLALSEPSAVHLDETTMTVRLTYNGLNPDQNVKIGYVNERGTFTALTIDKLEAVAGVENAYTVSLSGLPAENKPLVLEAKCGTLTSESLAVTRVPYTFSASVADAADVYAKKAYLTLSSADCNAAVLTKYAKAYLVNGDGTKTALKTTAVTSPDAILVEGLAAGTTNNIVVSLTGDPAQTCDPVAVTTETPTQLPNSGFDNWTSEKKGDYQYLWSTSDWTTVNNLTTSEFGSGSSNGLNCGGAAYKATSGTIPANSRTTKGTDSGGLIGTNKSGDGNTQGNATLHNDKQRTGGNAALIRTVGWSQNNSSSAKVSGQSFGTCKNKTAGELNLENYTFGSRPSSLTFYYHYDVVKSGNGDYGTVEVIVYDAAGTAIASASSNLAEQASYTKVSLPLSYNRGSHKAAKITVKFKSTGNAAAVSYNNLDFWRCPGVKNISGGEYVGSELYIDDIELVY